MINFKKIECKNALSYGNNTTVYNFEKGLTRITGDNGSGKSAITNDILYFALFGKPYRKINKSAIINSINKKDFIVKLTFEKNGFEYRIERGIKPDFFYIYKNNDIVSLSAHQKDYQSMLEKDILGFTEDLFNQIGIKSMAKNISFFSLTKQQKREIIENIFGIEIFSYMKDIVKQNITEKNTDSNLITKDIDYSNKVIELEKNKIIEIKKIQQSNQNSKIDELKNEKQDLLSKIEKIRKGFDIVKQNEILKNNLDNEINEYKQKIDKNKSDINSLKSKIDFMEKERSRMTAICQTCVKVNNFFSIDEINGYKNNIEEFANNIKINNDSINDKNVELVRLNEIVSKKIVLNQQFRDVQQKILDIDSKLKEIEKTIINIDETKLNEHKENLKQFQTAYDEVNECLRYYNVLRMLLADDGIKNYIIKKYLPYINKLLNTYLDRFQTDIIFNFDEDFNEIVKTRHKENFTYDNFSQGQKRRIDIAILFAFIDFCRFKNKHANMNILILDEIGFGLDDIGINIFYDILKEKSESENKEIITVQHGLSVERDKMDRIFNVRLNKGFSIIEEESKI